jgi:hypothetical protein
VNAPDLVDMLQDDTLFFICERHADVGHCARIDMCESVHGTCLCVPNNHTRMHEEVSECIPSDVDGAASTMGIVRRFCPLHLDFRAHQS